MSAFQQNTSKTHRLMTLLIFLLYLIAAFSGSLFHNHKFLPCNHNSQTDDHTSCSDSCPACNFLAVYHSTIEIDYPLLIADRLQSLLHRMPHSITVKQNEWACSIISRVVWRPSTVRTVSIRSFRMRPSNIVWLERTSSVIIGLFLGVVDECGLIAVGEFGTAETVSPDLTR